MSQPRLARSKVSKQPRSHDIKVLAKTFEILEALHRTNDNAARLSEIASTVKLPRPTVFRILRTLEKLNYVVFDGVLETYRIAQRLKDLGQSHLSEVIGRLGRPAMMRLLAEFEQTVNLAIFENDKLVYKDMVEGLRSVRMQPIPGTFLALSQSALGKSILAFLPREHVLSILRKEAQLLRAPSRSRISSRLAELLKVRKRGFAIDDQEFEKGLRCIGAPIFNKEGKPVASISVSGSTSILTPATIQLVGKRVKQACDEISLELGYSPLLQRNWR